ncbi:MAG TPA: hypothetical protein VKM55_22375 [Candidatus Lokiarchaeia archaeon]|nr:hypothetical protein [Candidatus Lokiarchaeia archaeon]
MAKIRLKLLNYFNLTLKRSNLEYEGTIVGDVILQFVADYKDILDPRLLTDDKTDFKEEPMNILLNGRNILYLDKYNTPLNDGDLIVLSIAIAGG